MKNPSQKRGLSLLYSFQLWRAMFHFPNGTLCTLLRPPEDCSHKRVFALGGDIYDIEAVALQKGSPLAISC